jgi:putative ABC transport system permease protein
MESKLVEISWSQLALATLLILVNGAISIVLQLQIGRSLLTAAARSVVQLMLLGLLLGWIFSVRQWQAVIAMGVAMTLAAGLTAVQRTHHSWAGGLWDSRAPG